MLSFEKIILHNFGSYGHAEVDLENKGFCLVSGKNNYKKDNALSNGSGKSFLWSGICFAITGETIQGLHTNLKNINIENDNTCYVTLYFKSGNDKYIITRHVSPKTDLKIIKNNADISGKGIRESEKKLGECLPDLNKDLIASTIIIGQGMPNKFSSFSPSGRKELLEKLTKSDFMVDDLKTRITNRLNELSIKSRDCEDGLLVNRTQLKPATEELDRKQTELQNAVKPNFDAEKKQINDELNKLDGQIKAETATRDTAQKEADDKAADLVTLNNRKTAEITNEAIQYTTAYNQKASIKTGLEFDIRNLNSEINRIKNIKDVCPTCGQKLQGVTKPDTTEMEEKVEQLKKFLESATSEVNTVNKKHSEFVADINNKYDNTKLNAEVSAARAKQNTAQRNLNTLLTAQNTYKQKLTDLILREENWDKYINGLNKSITDLEVKISQLNNMIGLLESG